MYFRLIGVSRVIGIFSTRIRGRSRSVFPPRLYESYFQQYRMFFGSTSQRGSQFSPRLQMY